MQKAITYPVTLDKFLCLCLPRLSGRTGEKFNLYRQYISASKMWERWKLAGDNSKSLLDFVPIKDEVDAQIAQDKARPFGEWEFRQCSALFIAWYDEHHRATVKEARRAGASAMHAKRKAALERKAKVTQKNKQHPRKKKAWTA